MNHAKQGKISKLKIGLLIICIVVVGVTFYMIQDIQTKIQKEGPQNTLKTEDKLENEENKIAENETIENTMQQNMVENQTTNTQQESDLPNTVVNETISESSKPAIPGVTDEKQKAIELVKKQWGQDDTVNYVFDYVNENGEYVIAVKDKVSATVKNYFRVNLTTQTVELD